jgi:hypothetical protein
MHVAFPRSDYYGASAPPGDHQPAMDLSLSRTGRPVKGRSSGGSHVHCATVRPARHPALPRQHHHAYAADIQRGLRSNYPNTAAESDPWLERDPRTAHQPISTRFELAQRLRGFNHRFTRVVPSGLASRTRIVWQYRHVPTLSGLLPALPGIPRIRLPPASTRLLRQPRDGGLSPPYGYSAPRGAPSRPCIRAGCGTAARPRR